MTLRYLLNHNDLTGEPDGLPRKAQHSAIPNLSTVQMRTVFWNHQL